MTTITTLHRNNFASERVSAVTHEGVAGLRMSDENGSTWVRLNEAQALELAEKLVKAIRDGVFRQLQQ